MQAESFPSTVLVRPRIFPTRRHLSPLGKSWRLMMIILGVMSLALLSLTPAWAGDGALDPSFDPGLGVQKIPIIRGQADWTASGVANGKSLIFGYFTSVTDSVTTYSRSSIARLTDTSGTVDPNFNIPVNGEVRGAYLADPENPTSDIIIWGSFSLTSEGTTFYNLAQLTWNGSAYAVNKFFPVIFNQGGLVKSVAVLGTYMSNKVMVGGYNMQVNPAVGGDISKAYHLICLNPNFSYFSAYAGLSLPGGIVDLISVNTANLPRIFGTLPQSGGGYHWFEALDSTFTLQKSLGTSATSGTNYGPIDGPIYSMGQPSGTSGPWIIVGAFKNVFNMTLNSVAQLTYDLSGRDDTNSFNTNINLGGGADHAVQQLYVLGNGQPILAGGFTKFNGTTPSYGHIVRLKYAPDTGGTVDTTFNYNLGLPLTPTAGADDRIFKLYKLPGSSPTLLQILGSFQHYNGTARGGIATIDHQTGNIQSSYASVTPTSDTPGTVYAMEGDNNGGIIIGGDFTGVGGKYRLNLARLNWDGSLDESFIGVAEGPVRRIRTLNGGQVLLAGNFGQIQGYGCTGLARLNATFSWPNVTYDLDTAFRPMLTQSNGTLADLRMLDADDSGNIWIGGDFSTVNGWAKTSVAHLLSTGALDTGFTFDPASLQHLSDIKVKDGGGGGADFVYIIGKATYSGSTCGFGTRLLSSGALDTDFGPSGGTTPVNHVLVFDGQVLCGGGGEGDSRLYLGGDFTHYLDGSVSPPARGHLARITANGLLDTTFAPTGADNSIYTMDVLKTNGKILIAGAFTSYNGTSRNAVARLNADGSLDRGFNPGTGANGPVFCLSWDSMQGKAVLGGAFTTYNDASRRGIARIFSSGGSFNPGIFLLLLN